VPSNAPGICQQNNVTRLLYTIQVASLLEKPDCTWSCRTENKSSYSVSVNPLHLARWGNNPCLLPRCTCCLLETYMDKYKIHEWPSNGIYPSSDILVVYTNQWHITPNLDDVMYTSRKYCTMPYFCMRSMAKEKRSSWKSYYWTDPVMPSIELLLDWPLHAFYTQLDNTV
jgi:hypothetical protein